MARRNQRPLTDEERDARRQADRERMEQAARTLLTSEGWQRWIRVRASNGLARYCLLYLGPVVFDVVGLGFARSRHVVESGFEIAMSVVILVTSGRSVGRGRLKRLRQIA